MAKLILTHEGAVVKEYDLDKESTFVGRKPNNDIQLDDPTVSGRHAVFHNLKNIYIEDLNSTNGTLLNGKKVNKRQLEHGDVVRIGHHELKFINENAQDFESTVIISASDVPTATAAPKKAALRVLNGPKSGSDIELNKPYTTLGQPGGQVAVVAKRGTNYFLMYMGGTGNTGGHPVLNGKPISAESVQLKQGDIIEVGGTKVEFQG